jgi:dCTP deaminase
MHLLSKNVNGASIDLRIDSTAYVRTDTKPLILSDTSTSEDILKDRLEPVDLAKGYLLEPNKYLYGKAFETINIPKNMCGFIFPRSTFARIGLILPISCYANPGYCGQLPLIIYNASPVSVEIPPFYRIAQILFVEIDGEAVEYSQQKDAKYHNETGAGASLDDSELKLQRKITKDDILKLLGE